MTARSTTVRPVTWGGALLTLVPLTLPIVALHLAGMSFDESLLGGATIFLSYRILFVRLLVLRDHRRGILAIRAGRFAEGLEAFRRSEAAFEQRRTLDRLRALLLGSASRYPFRILARYNQAYALSRLGRGEEALERLDAVLAEEPQMTMAQELRDVLLAGSRLHPDVGRAMDDREA